MHGVIVMVLLPQQVFSTLVGKSMLPYLLHAAFLPGSHNQPATDSEEDEHRSQGDGRVLSIPIEQLEAQAKVSLESVIPCFLTVPHGIRC